jgi:hypothetical protein
MQAWKLKLDNPMVGYVVVTSAPRDHLGVENEFLYL